VELHQLRAFVAVANEGSFTRAAKHLHVVQSAVSAAVRALEHELGVRLFDRNTRQVALSDAGRALLPEARNVLAAVDLALDAVRQVGSGMRGTVTVGVMQAPGMRALRVARMLADFRTGHPLVTLNVRHAGGSHDAAQLVRDGELDLAFVSLPERQSEGLELTLLASETMVVACAGGHPLVGRADVDLGELADETFVELPAGWGTRMATDRAFDAAGVRRTIEFEVNDTTSLLEFVREGLAIAVLPPSITAETPDISLVPIRSGAPTFDTFLARASGRRPTAAADALAALVNQHAL
jgi:DNA-binding transcriptional LysR family regulator